MQKTLSKLSLGLAIILTSAHAYADGTDHSARMHVQISNNTGVNCQLSDQYLSHGRLINSPPQSLMIGDSKSFDAIQTLMGPEISLSYDCGNGRIRFDVQQDLVLFMGHEPKLQTLEADGLKVTATSTSSSVLWNSPGIINITILPSS